jgi:hypothetical protein
LFIFQEKSHLAKPKVKNKTNLANIRAAFTNCHSASASLDQYHQHFIHNFFVQKCFSKISQVKFWLCNFFFG